MAWNLPDGCTDFDIDYAAGGYDEPDYEPEPELVVGDEPPDELVAQWDAADEGDARYSALAEEDDMRLLTPRTITVKVARLTAPELIPEVA